MLIFLTKPAYTLQTKHVLGYHEEYQSYHLIPRIMILTQIIFLENKLL